MLDKTQYRAPLAEAIKAYINQGYASFHMPGHKGGAGAEPQWKQLLGGKALLADLTEVEGLDDLHQPSGVIDQAQKLAGMLLGAKEAYFLINGVSVGLHAGILALCKPGDKIIIPRHAHRSIYGAIALAGAKPVYLQTPIHPDLGIPLGTEFEEADKVLNEHPDAKALILVHPTYHGIVSDLPGIIGLAQKLGIKTMVDEAHGAHFAFSEEFPFTALASGADFVAQGWHKTMGSLTQTGLLLLNQDEGKIKEYLGILQSTSPSYLLMGSLDAARLHWAKEGKHLAEKILELAGYFRQQIKINKGIICLHQENINFAGLMAADQTKVLLNAYNIGLNGFQLAELLRSRYHIQPEMAEYGAVTLMLTIGDTKEKINYLLESLTDITARAGSQAVKADFCFETPPLPKIMLTPGEALRRPQKKIKLRDAVNFMAGEALCPYPPGIPLVLPGEIITEEIRQLIEDIYYWGGKVHGLDVSDMTVQVIE